jgi:hypothetical protein
MRSSSPEYMQEGMNVICYRIKEVRAYSRTSEFAQSEEHENTCSRKKEKRTA